MKNTAKILCVLFLTGCGSGPCREQRTTAGAAAQETSMTQVKPSERVRVYKPDGSLQCGMGKAISAEAMKSELKGIKIHSSENKNDGMMRTQVCGSPTGNINIYEIDRTDLEKARKAGFKEWIGN